MGGRRGVSQLDLVVHDFKKGKKQADADIADRQSDGHNDDGASELESPEPAMVKPTFGGLGHQLKCPRQVSQTLGALEHVLLS